MNEKFYLPACFPRAGPVLLEHFCFKRLQYSQRAFATPLQVFPVRTQRSHGLGAGPTCRAVSESVNDIKEGWKNAPLADRLRL